MEKLRASRMRRIAINGTISLVLAASFALPVAGAYATPASSKQAEAQSALASLNSMQEKLDEASSNHWLAVKEQQDAEAKMTEAQARIDEASDKIVGLRGKLGVRARNMYRSGSSTVLDLLLGSTTFTEFATNWDILNQMNQSDAQLVSETKALRDTIKSSKDEYAEQARVASIKAEEAKKIEDQAKSTVDQMQATYNALSAEASALLEQERAAQAAAAQARANEVVAEASRPSGGSSSSSSRPSGGSSGGSSNAPSYNASTGNAIVDRARSALGKPYVWGAVGPNGYDCSGLVGYALTGRHSRIGVAATFAGYPRVSDPQPGDICANSHHCGIYIGNGQMIHASTYGVGVIVGPVGRGMVITRPR